MTALSRRIEAAQAAQRERDARLRTDILAAREAGETDTGSGLVDLVGALATIAAALGILAGVAAIVAAGIGLVL